MLLLKLLGEKTSSAYRGSWVTFHFKVHRLQSYNNFGVSSSINGDGAAEPVSDNLNEGEEENGAEEFSSSWPTTFTSTPSDAEESDAPKQVQHLGCWTVI